MFQHYFSPIIDSRDNLLTIHIYLLLNNQHVFADTLRSTAVLIAAGMSYTFKIGAPAVVDAVAALAVSLIILCSLGPLLGGIFHAWGDQIIGGIGWRPRSLTHWTVIV